MQSFLDIFCGQRPDVTPAQLLAVLLTGIPILSALTAAFGIWTPTPEQQDALSRALGWGFGISALLIGGDAAHRVARNSADAKVKAAALVNPVGSQDHVNAVAQAVIAQLATSGTAPGGDGGSVVDREPTDEEEFAPGTGPDDAPEAALEARAPGGPPPDLDVGVRG